MLLELKLKEGKEAIQTVYNWDFDKLVMIHGNVIEKDGKDAWKKLFASSLFSSLLLFYFITRNKVDQEIGLIFEY